MITMSNQKVSKLNQILQYWKHNTVSVSNWFQLYGVNRFLLNKYVTSKWIKRIGYGAYIKSGNNVDWSGGLYAIQKQLKLYIHVSGKSALQLHGLAHYLPIGNKVYIELFGEPGAELPVWFKNYDWKVQIKYFTSNLFNNDIGLTEKDFATYTITISTPERAIMELLHHVPENQTFDEADKIMEGLFSLRPDLVLTLLKECNSIKVKRLFLYLAEKNSLPVLKHLNINDINLGSGKRLIVKDGILDKKYNITVPKQDFLDEQIP